MGTRKTTAGDVSRASPDIETEMIQRSWDESGGCPCSWPDGVRHGGGVSLVCGLGVERGKARADTAPRWCSGCERKRAAQQKLRGIEYRCGRAGGPVRSSVEALVMGVERRDRLTGVCSFGQPGRLCPGRIRVSGLGPGRVRLDSV